MYIFLQQFLIVLNDRGQIQAQTIKNHYQFLKEQWQAGFQALKISIQSGRKPIVIICGGDGTVMWVVNCFAEFDIDPKKAPLAIIPLGTGNDFSRVLGWGGQINYLLDNNFQQLKKRLYEWHFATEEKFDIWDVVAQVYEYGFFEKVQELKSKKIPGTILEKSFSNYFSFGVDGKIGYTFDKHRTSSKLGNLMMYGILGCFKGNQPTRNVEELLSTMSIVKQQPGVNTKIPMFHTKSAQHARNFSQVILRSKLSDIQGEISKQQSKKQIEQPQKKERIMQKQYCNILAQNINSYMGGVTDIWRNASSGINNEQQVKKFNDQSYSDGKLQFLSFVTPKDLALERVKPGLAQKVTQGSGPYLFEFNQQKNRQKFRTYLQIDGQYIRFTNPKSILIRKSTVVPNGQIRVLRRVQI